MKIAHCCTTLSIFCSKSCHHHITLYKCLINILVPTSWISDILLLTSHEGKSLSQMIYKINCNFMKFFLIWIWLISSSHSFTYVLTCTTTLLSTMQDKCRPSLQGEVTVKTSLTTIYLRHVLRCMCLAPYLIGSHVTIISFLTWPAMNTSVNKTDT